MTRATMHNVRAGESPASIASMHGVSVRDLVRANMHRLWSDETASGFALPLFVGEELFLPQSTTPLERRLARLERRRPGTLGEEEPTPPPPEEPTNADLQSFGFNSDQIASPENRAAAVKAYNDTRTAMEQAKQGKTLNAISSGVGVAVVALAFTFPPASALLAAFWAGGLAALKGLQEIFGTAHAGLGQWTEFCSNTPPIDENDPNWWHADTGYSAALQKYGRGSDTPFTRNVLGHGWPHEPEMHGFGPVDARVARVDPKAQPFARFALPLVYRAYELTMNCRNWSKIGGVEYANTPYDLGKTEGGVAIANPFDVTLDLWNSQHAGPSIEVAGDVFPLAPSKFSINTGSLIEKVQHAPAKTSTSSGAGAAVATVGIIGATATAFWIALSKSAAAAAARHAVSRTFKRSKR